MKLTIEDLIKVCNGKLISGDTSLTIDNISKDTRSIKVGDIYVGIKGDNFDGNLFFDRAFELGAVASILDNPNLDFTKHQDKTIILVDNTIKALQDIAHYKRMLYDIPVIAITGSVGKTSTKDLIASVLSEKYKVLKTEGNFNNHIGLPLTILSLKDEEVMVLEMGMNNLGEIALLSKIASPTIGVITNIGTAHIGLLGSRENILKAKLEILDGMKNKDNLIINNDNDLLHNYSLKNKVITVGIKESSQYEAINIKHNYSLFDIKGNINNVPNSLLNEAFIINSLLAYAVSQKLDISNEEFLNGLNKFNLASKRLEKINNNRHLTIINDSYNANYDSMKVCLEHLKNTSGKRKIAVLGDMLELGKYAKELHEKVGLEVVKNKVDILVTVGELSLNINKSAIKNNFNKDNSYHFENNLLCGEFLNNFLKKEDVIIFKASKKMKLNEIIDIITYN